MKQLRISTIVNNHNYGAYLPRAVDSALAQEGVVHEVIVVDDGSTDDSRDRLAPYGNRIRRVFQENGGQASAINAGVRASRGDILAFLDADDWWLPGKLAAIADLFARRPEVGLAYHRLQPVHSDGRPAFRAIPRSLSSGDLAPRMLRTGGRWPFPMTSAIAVRRTVWNEAGEIPPALRISADAWLVGVLPFLTRVAAVGAPLGAYRIHANNWYRASDDAPMLRRRMAHWEATVVFTNAFLEAHGIAGRLDLRDHFPYQAAAAALGERQGDLSLLRLGLMDGGENNPLRRARDAARAWLGARSAPFADREAV